MLLLKDGHQLDVRIVNLVPFKDHPAPCHLESSDQDTRDRLRRKHNGVIMSVLQPENVAAQVPMRDEDGEAGRAGERRQEGDVRAVLPDAPLGQLAADDAGEEARVVLAAEELAVRGLLQLRS